MLSENIALTLLIKILGPSISKTILARLSGENTFLETTGGEIIDSINAKLEPYSQPEKKIVEDVALRIFDQTKSLFGSEGIKLDEGGVFSVKMAFAQVLANAEITPDMVLSQDLSSLTLENYLKSINSAEMRDFNAEERALYDSLIKAFSEKIVIEISQCEDFIAYFASETLTRQTKTLTDLESIKEQGNAQKRELYRISKQQTEAQDQALQANRQLEEIKSLLNSNPIENIDSLLNEASGRNPGLSFQLINNPPNPPTIVVTATTSDNPVSISKLGFPDTEAGKRGLEKFRLLIEEGQTASFKEGEFEWDWQFKMPTFVGPSPILAEFQLAHNLPNIDIPVRLEVVANGEVLYEIGFAYFKIVRSGTKQTTFQVHSIHFPAVIDISLNDTSELSFNISEVDLSRISIQKADSYLNCLLTMAEADELRILSLEFEKVIFETKFSQKQDIDFDQLNQLKCIHQFIRWTSAINSRLGLNFRVPEKISPQDFETAADLFEILTKGTLLKGRSRLHFEYNRNDALKILEDWNSDETQNLAAHYEDSKEDFLGQSINLGPLEISFSGVSLIQDADKLRAQIDAAEAQDIVSLELRSESTIYKLLSFFTEV
ncbi:MAG: hypothetical protein AAF609_12180 [Cyanobacteria bacterium P01_C01_bin.120]